MNRDAHLVKAAKSVLHVAGELFSTRKLRSSTQSHTFLSIVGPVRCTINHGKRAEVRNKGKKLTLYLELLSPALLCAAVNSSSTVIVDAYPEHILEVPRGTREPALLQRTPHQAKVCTRSLLKLSNFPVEQLPEKILYEWDIYATEACAVE